VQLDRQAARVEQRLEVVPRVQERWLEIARAIHAPVPERRERPKALAVEAEVREARVRPDAVQPG
jgi:hypothetical protein